MIYITVEMGRATFQPACRPSLHPHGQRNHRRRQNSLSMPQANLLTFTGVSAWVIPTVSSSNRSAILVPRGSPKTGAALEHHCPVPKPNERGNRPCLLAQENSSS